MEETLYDTSSLINAYKQKIRSGFEYVIENP
jgi:hypothetical protein